VCALRGDSPRQASDTTLQIAVNVMFIARWLAAAGLVLGGMSPRLLAAQASVDTAPPPVHIPRVALWGSAELGNAHIASVSTIHGAAIATINLSVGPVMLSFRDAGPFIGIGDFVRDDGLLAGVRTSGRRLFGSAELGFANASHHHECDGCGASRVEPSVGVMVYDVSAHANLLVVGAAASFSGIVGPARVRYSAFTLGLEAGWFGHRRCARAKWRRLAPVCSIFSA
jgi:hypothetical protein